MDKKKIILGKDLVVAALLALLSFALYIRTLAPNLLTADAAEFQTLAYTLGMTHASGYTTYILMGKIFTLIPIANIAYRVNLMSAFFGALAVGQLYLIIRLLGGWRIAAITGAVALTIHPLFWRRTIFAETYAPAASMLASVFLLVLLWKESKKAHYLFLAGLIGGISVGIHSTVVMTASAVFIYMLFKTRHKKEWISAASGATLGLLIFFLAFLYLDHNNPPSSIYQTSYITNLDARSLTLEEFDSPIDRLLAIFPAESFWTYYFSAELDVIRERLQEYVGFYPVWELAVIIFGIFSLFFIKKDGKSLLPEALYLLTAFIFIWGFAVTVKFDVYQEFYVPVAVLVHIWLGVGLSVLLSGIGRFIERYQANLPKNVYLMPSLLGVAFVAALLIHSKADLNLAIREGYTTFIRDEKIYPYFKPDRYVRLSSRIVNKIEDDAILFDAWDRIYSHVYTAHILSGRTGISFHEVFPGIGETTLEYIAENIDHRPIYFAFDHPEISTYYDLEQIGDGLYRLRNK